MIYKYYVYQNDVMVGCKASALSDNEDVLYQYRDLETDLKFKTGAGSEVIITHSSPKIGVMVNIDSNKSRDEVGFLLGESLKRLNRQNPRLYLSARYMEG